MNPADVSQVARRDQLLEQIREILHPQLMGESALTVEQHRALQAAIANFTVDLLTELRPPNYSPRAGWTADMT